MNDDFKVAIITDQLTKLGGAEWHMKAVAEVFPDAPIYTSVAENRVIEEFFPDRNVKTSFVQYLPFEKRLRQEYSILWPLGFKLFRLKKYDLIISVSAAYSKMVKVSQDSKHIILCLTPPRFLYMPDRRSTLSSEKLSYKIYEKIKDPIHGKLKEWDIKAAKDADLVVANSGVIQKRISKFYGLGSQIIYPPVDVDGVDFNPDIKSRGDSYLYLGRLESYKGVDLAIRAVAKLGKKLIIAGTGAYEEKLKVLTKELKVQNLVRFEGFVTESRKKSLMFNSKALIFPVKDEDFGIVPIEANAAGCPVISFKGGGPVETLSEDNPRTAVFFEELNVDSLAKAIEKFEKLEFNPDSCRKQAKQFSKKIYQYKIKRVVDEISES